MACTVCPNCGLDLERYGRVEHGDVVVEPHEVRWKGKRVALRPSGRILVSALVRADGIPVKRQALVEVLGCDDAQDPDNIVAVQICHTARAFRDVDPTFTAIQNVRGTGIRWAA